MSQPSPKQTKKQRKAFAFRTRQRTGKKKNKDLDDEDVFNFPMGENQDLGGLAVLPLEAEEVSTGGRPGSRKSEAEHGGKHQAPSKKRKREGEEVTEQRPQKKSKAQQAALESCVEGGNVEKSAEVKKAQSQRFILFIGSFLPPVLRLNHVSSVTTAGNLKYSTTKDAILSHFSSCGKVGLPLEFITAHMFVLDPPPTVRLPTPKTTQPSLKSKGYAFLEFTDKKALQQALRLHHSGLEGRTINVELTTGGGGNSEHRIKKLQERNKGLHEQRVPQIHIPSFLWVC